MQQSPNHGIRPWLTILGRPIGRLMPEGALRSAEMGSIIVIVATDAPLPGLSLRQMAKRAALGIGRGGTPGGNNSGDIFLAFSTANEGPMPQFSPAILTKAEVNGDQMDPVYLAAVEAIEESVVNAMVAGEDVVTGKPAGLTCRAIALTDCRRSSGWRPDPRPSGDDPDRHRAPAPETTSDGRPGQFAPRHRPDAGLSAVGW